jgi:4'-phosphopantetheinyl transferase EntD
MRALGRDPYASGLIGTLIPASACAESFSDVAEATMFPVEAAAVAGAVGERRREFATVRSCARDALRRIGVPAAPVLPDRDGVPQWPAGVVGSMTHCARYRAASVALANRVGGIGIDAEPHAAVPDGTLDLVVRDDERARLDVLADTHPGVHWDRIVFCAKEAVFKVWFPLTRRWLDFTDVSTTVQPDGTFAARVWVGSPRVGTTDLSVLGGRWVIGRGLVAAGCSVGSPRARRPVVRRRWRP